MDHWIDSIDPTTPLHHPWFYRIYEDEHITVKCTINDYIYKGWIILNSSPYGAPAIVICKKAGEHCIVIDYHLFKN